MVSIFYNKTTLNDTLVISVLNEYDEIKHINNNVVGYFNQQVAFINIFNVSTKYKLNEGWLQLDGNICNIVLKETQVNLIPTNHDSPLIVGKIISFSDIKNTHLHYCQVDINATKPLNIVCGANNVQQDALVVVAQLGAIIPNGLTINPSKLMGYESQGMLCSARELKIENKFNTSGIIILAPTYVVGQQFTEAFNK